MKQQQLAQQLQLVSSSPKKQASKSVSRPVVNQNHHQNLQLLLRNPNNINQLVFQVNKLYDSQDRKLKSASTKPIYSIKKSSVPEKQYYQEYQRGANGAAGGGGNLYSSTTVTKAIIDAHDMYPLVTNGPIILANENNLSKNQNIKNFSTGSQKNHLLVSEMVSRLNQLESDFSNKYIFPYLSNHNGVNGHQSTSSNTKEKFIQASHKKQSFGKNGSSGGIYSILGTGQLDFGQVRSQINLSAKNKDQKLTNQSSRQDLDEINDRVEEMKIEKKVTNPSVLEIGEKKKKFSINSKQYYENNKILQASPINVEEKKYLNGEGAASHKANQNKEEQIDNYSFVLRKNKQSSESQTLISSTTPLKSKIIKPKIVEENGNLIVINKGKQSQMSSSFVRSTDKSLHLMNANSMNVAAISNVSNNAILNSESPYKQDALLANKGGGLMSRSLQKGEGSTQQKYNINQDCLVAVAPGSSGLIIELQNHPQRRSFSKGAGLKKKKGLSSVKKQNKLNFKRSIESQALESLPHSNNSSIYPGIMSKPTQTLTGFTGAVGFNQTVGGFQASLVQSSGLTALTSARNLYGDGYKYQIFKGNNSQLVKRVMMNRYWWSENGSGNGVTHFKWTPCSIKADFPKLAMQKQKMVINHFENHKEMTRKNELFSNMSQYFHSQGQNVFEYCPLTYQIVIPEGKFQNLDNSLRKFQQCYDLLEHFKYQIVELNKQSKNSIELLSFKKIEQLVHSKYAPRNLFQKQSPTKYVMPVCHFIGGNVWLLKTTCMNRGRGIHVFKTFKQLKNILRQYIFSSNDDLSIQNKTANGNNAFQYIPKTLNFVIQKYIERPMLINRRKFDIRVWVLVTQEMEVFFFKEGYLRTACSEYKLDNCEDQYIHLTNNAVQKNSKNYGQFEDGNQLSFKDFQKYIEEHYNGKVKIDVQKDLVQDMKLIVIKTIDSIKKKLNSENRKFCFELFGYDFIIDQDFSVWLIEVNTNPCIEESSQVLKILLPRMIDDMFKLTIDKIFPNPKETQLMARTLGFRSQNLKQNSQIMGQNGSTALQNSIYSPINTLYNQYQTSDSIYHVEGYSNCENMWEKIMEINTNKILIEQPERKIRSEHIIYLPESLDFYVTPYKSYKKYTSNQKYSSNLLNLNNNPLNQNGNNSGSSTGNGLLIQGSNQSSLNNVKTLNIGGSIGSRSQSKQENQSNILQKSHMATIGEVENI